MSPIILSVTIIAYFVILFTISYIAGHKADNEGFFVGNRKSAWYIVAFAMIGSTISGVTFVSVPGMVQASSFSYLQMVLGFIVGQFIIAFVLVPLFYRMKLVSIYEYLEQELHMTIVNSKRIMTVEKVTEIDEKYLHLKVKDYNCVAVVSSQTYNSDGVMFEYTKSRHRPDHFLLYDNARRR